MSLLLALLTTGVTGTAALEQVPQQLSASGELAFIASGSLTQTPQTVSSTGVLGFSGVAALSQVPQTTSGTASLSFSGSAMLQQQPQFVSATGVTAIPIYGTAELVQHWQSISAMGNVVTVRSVGRPSMPFNRIFLSRR